MSTDTMPLYPFAVTTHDVNSGELLTCSTYMTLNGALRGYDVTDGAQLWVQTATGRYRIDPFSIGEPFEDTDF